MVARALPRLWRGRWPGRLVVSAGGSILPSSFPLSLAKPPFRGFASSSSSGSMTDDLIRYSRTCQSRSAAVETLSHGSQMVERDSKGYEVEGLVRLSLAAAELLYLDGKSEEVETECNKAISLLIENDEILNAKFQSEGSLFARHLLTLIYLSQGKDGLANDLTSTYADVDVSFSAYDFQSSIIGKKSKRGMAAVYEGMKGLLDHSLGARDLALESWNKVAEGMGSRDIREWKDRDSKLFHVMKNYSMFLHCLGDSDERRGAEAHFDYVAEAAMEEAGKLEDSVGLWGSVPMLREVANSSRFGAAQVLVRDKKLEEAEKKLEGLLHEHGETFSDSDSRAGLIIMKLAQAYFELNRLTLAEGLYRTASKLLSASSASIFDDPSGETSGCHPTCIALLEYNYSKLLRVIPRREEEADKILKRSEQRWREDVCPLTSLEDISARGIIDLQTQRLLYL